MPASPLAHRGCKIRIGRHQNVGREGLRVIHGGNNRPKPTCVNRQMPTDSKKFWAASGAEDHQTADEQELGGERVARLSHSKSGAQNQVSQLGFLDALPRLEKIERARIIHELAVAWGVDLRLVLLIAARSA